MYFKENDRNLRISQMHIKKKVSMDSQIRHKQKGEEKFDKNLRISQIHHKKKESIIIKKIKNGKNIFRILGTILIFMTIGLSLVVFVAAEPLINTENNISAKEVAAAEPLINTENISTNEEFNVEGIGPLNQTEETVISSSGIIYYVAKNGNDNNPGTETRPWLTISKAANTITVGSTVYIKTGTYKEKIIPKYSGSSGNYITFAAYPGNNVTIDGTGIGVSSWSGLVQISSKSYINITGLRIINSGWAGIFVSSSHHINLKKNYIYKTISSGILMAFGNSYVADGNEIVLGNNGQTNQEILSMQHVNIFDIMNNYLHDGRGIGIDAKDGASNGKIHHNKVYKVGIGIYADAWDKTQSNIDIHSNKVSMSETGIGLAGEIGGTLNNISIFNNLIYDNIGMGIRIPLVNNYGNSHLNNIKVSNNVVYHNGYPYGTGGISIGEPFQAYIYNLIIKNNIVSQNDYYQIKYIPNSRHSNIVIDHNLIDGYRGIINEVRGTNYIEGNPLFMDLNIRDFHLKSTSPAIDKGSSSSAPIIDFDGVLRPKGVGYDIGSYERAKTSITVISPNGGENWRRNTIHTISWSSYGGPGSYVKIELVKGGVLNRVISSSTSNDGSYSWTIPTIQTLGTDYKIKITSISNSVYVDTSNNNFIISS